eukprot:78739-Chlamydomonas_euryale.AAC.6
MGATYVSGAMIYAFRVPERFFPGYFDLFFHGHQIFHVAVVAGAWIHLHAVRRRIYLCAWWCWGESSLSQRQLGLMCTS